MHALREVLKALSGDVREGGRLGVHAKAGFGLSRLFGDRLIEWVMFRLVRFGGV